LLFLNRQRFKFLFPYYFKGIKFIVAFKNLKRSVWAI